VQPSVADALVADSGCSATALAAGVTALPGTLGLNAQGAAVESVLERAKRAGKSVGLVSDTRITHATPAAFVAHVIDRDLEYDIARQIAASKADVLLSGGRSFFSKPNGAKISALELAKTNGFKIANNFNDLKSSVISGSTPLLGLFAESAMQNGIAEKQHLALNIDAKNREPTLVEMSAAALKLLSKNPEGFFLMIEAGQIDWAGHANDAGWLLHEMIRIDSVVDLVAQWQAESPDTLLIVTADHETGGFGFSYSSAAIPTPHALAAQPSGTLPYAADYNFVSPAVLKNLARQKTPIAEIFRQVKVGAQQPDSAQRLVELVQSTLGHQITIKQATDLLTPERNEFRVPGHADLNDELVPKINDFSAFYPKSINRATAALARLLAARSGIVWATGNHTSTPVPLFAIGPGQDSFKGIPTQVDVGAKLASIF